MKARFFSAMLAAFMLATASVGGITASAAERASAGEDTAETTAVDEDSSADTTETTADTAESSILRRLLLFQMNPMIWRSFVRS